jgi:hypothetical protein
MAASGVEERKSGIEKAPRRVSKGFARTSVQLQSVIAAKICYVFVVQNEPFAIGAFASEPSMPIRLNFRYVVRSDGMYRFNFIW